VLYCTIIMGSAIMVTQVFNTMDKIDSPQNTFSVHGQVTIIFVVSVGLSVCLFVQSFSQPSLI